MKAMRMLAAMLLCVAVALPSAAKKKQAADAADAPRQWTQLLWPDGAPHPKTIAPDKDGKIREAKNLGDTAKVHVFLPAPSKANGQAVVLAPGGGYVWLAIDNEGFGWKDFFNDRGTALIVLQYRLPDGVWQVPLEDIQEAVRLVRRNAQAWNINPDAIGVGGSSAGGHLASTAITAFEHPVNEDPVSCRPDFGILFYPVISGLPDYSHGGSRTALFAGPLTCEQEKQFSNERHVTAQTPPTIIFFSSDDDIVNPANGLLFYQALYDAGVPASLHIYPEGRHGWGSNPNFKFRQTMLHDLSSWMDNLQPKP